MSKLSYEAMQDMARKFIADCEITDSPEEFESSVVPMYLVDDVAQVIEAFIEDMENRVNFEDEDDVGAFLARHNIKW